MMKFVSSVVNLSGKLLVSASLVSVVSIGVARADVSRQPLKGGVEDTNLVPSREEKLNPEVPMATPVLPPKKLQGNVEHADKILQGNAEDEDGNLKGLAGQADKNDKVLKARVQDNSLGASDPDTVDQELMVQWDKWRNRFLWAVQSGVQDILNNSDDPNDSNVHWDPRRQAIVRQFPLGTEAWFHCQIRSDRKIVNFKLLQSSGYPNYDKAVEEAVAALQDSAILRFPAKSRRERVSQDAGIKTAESSQTEFFHFGDVEKYRTPGGQ